MSTKIRVKRIYDEASDDDGYRILVDRLWPRGVSKAAARVDLWAKELTPSHELRKWFHEDAASRCKEFAARYRQELESRRSEIELALAGLKEPTITLVTASKDLVQGHSTVLKRFLKSRIL